MFTNNDEWAALVASYRVHGTGSNKYDNVRIGLNSRLDTMQAAVLQVKLSVFDEELMRVNEAARLYTDLLKNSVTTPTIPNGFGSSWAQYTIRLAGSEQRKEVQQALNEAGIPSMIYYPHPMHSQTAFENVRQPIHCERFIANRLCDTVLSLPIHPYITNEEIKQVTSCLQSQITNH